MAGVNSETPTPSELKTMTPLAKTLYGFVYLWRRAEVTSKASPETKNDTPAAPSTATPATIVKRSFFNKFDSVCSFDDPRREIAVMRQISPHPNVIQFYGSRVNQVEKYWDLYMEYAPGGDMFEFVTATGNGLSEPQAKDYLRQILAGLHYLHVQHQLSHMDLSLENLLLMGEKTSADTATNPTHRLVLTDFGSTIANKLNYRFLSHMRPGKTHYQAPEMHVSDLAPYPDDPSLQTTTIPSTTAVDIFAFGVIMFEILVAHPPFKNVRDKRYDVYFRKLGSVGYLLPAVHSDATKPPPHHASAEAIRIIDWCLQEKPEKRPTVEQLLSLDYFRAGVTPETKPTKVTTLEPAHVAV